MAKSAYVSVGSNLGNKLINCYRGISNIGKSSNSSVVCCSDFYLTSPTDYKAQGWFVNGVVKIETILNPNDLLDELASIQHIIGRKVNTLRFGPRKLDLDIIFYEDNIINSPGLEIPHPRMHVRLFVLKPICDIDPDFVHPVFKVSVGSILSALARESQKAILIDHSKYTESFEL